MFWMFNKFFFCQMSGNTRKLKFMQGKYFSDYKPLKRFIFSTNYKGHYYCALFVIALREEIVCGRNLCE